MARRPNVLLITCDQWRGDTLSAAGHPVVKTPNADALAKDGVMFTRHYAGAAPCSPARACIYTGLYQMNNRVCRNGTPLDARHGNIALWARALGYEPTLFGYTDVSPDPRFHHPGDPVLKTYEGVLAGFAVRQGLPEHQKQWLSWLKQQGLEPGSGFPDVHRPANGDVKSVNRTPPIYSKDQTPAAFLTGEFVRWVGEREEPCFAHISYLSPHPPFIVPEPFNEMYDAAGGPGFHRQKDWETEAATHPFVARELDRQKRKSFLPGHKGKVRDFSDDEFRTIRAIYWGMVSEVDSQLGRLWDAIRAAGAWEDTIIVLTSDHAEMMGDHFMLGKGGFFDQSYHLPLIIRAPGAKKGAKVDAFTEAVDISPTLVDLMGGEPGAWLDGHSLKAFTKGKTTDGWRDAAHWEFDFRILRRARTSSHSGSSRSNAISPWCAPGAGNMCIGRGVAPLLYDLSNDPGELRNRAEEPECRTVRLEMAERLLAWRAEHLDQSLALAELTEEGIAGSYAPASWRNWR